MTATSRKATLYIWNASCKYIHQQEPQIDSNAMSGMTVSCWERLSGHRLAHYQGWCTNSHVTRPGGRWTKSEHNVWEQAPNLTGNNIVWVGQQRTYGGEHLLHVLCERSGRSSWPQLFPACLFSKLTGFRFSTLSLQVSAKWSILPR